MVDLTAEQRQLAKTVHDYACQFPLTENGDAQLLQGFMIIWMLLNG